MTLRTRLETHVRQTFERVPPRKYAPHFLVYYDGSPTGLAALREACEMAKPGTRITTVCLEPVPFDQEIPEDARVNNMRTQAILAAAMVNARLYNAEIETLALACHSKGAALVALATKQHNPVLFIGITENEMQRKLDAFTEYVLALAPCKVVLVSALDKRIEE